MLFKSIMKCDIDIINDLYKNIVLSGGSTMFKNIDLRLKKEIKILLSHKSIEINIISPVERKYCAWIGGSILSSLCTFYDKLITRDEYDESGPGIVNRSNCGW